jgi:hypothetical protein
VSKIELPEKSHDRKGFDGGSESLNLFLQQTERQHAERGISRTFILVEEDDLVAKNAISCDFLARLTG